jgi:hypothetical protein
VLPHAAVPQLAAKTPDVARRHDTVEPIRNCLYKSKVRRIRILCHRDIYVPEFRLCGCAIELRVKGFSEEASRCFRAVVERGIVPDLSLNEAVEVFGGCGA